MSEEYILGYLLDEEDIEAIDFMCKKCGHSSDEHEKVRCTHGMFRKCECKHFVLDQEQLNDAKRELQTIEDILFENYKEAKRLNDHD